MRIRDGKIRIRDKHPGTAKLLLKSLVWHNICKCTRVPYRIKKNFWDQTALRMNFLPIIPFISIFFHLLCYCMWTVLKVSVFQIRLNLMGPRSWYMPLAECWSGSGLMINAVFTGSRTTPGPPRENPTRKIRFLSIFGSVADPHVFGPPGSGSIIQRYRSGSFYYQAKVVRYTFIPAVLWLLFELLSLKNVVNVPSKSNGRRKKNFF
jgi:hypothetical protein